MSMSTRIDDLPGPIPEDVRGDLNLIQDDILSHQQTQQLQQPELQQQELQQYLNPNQSNIKMNIKKKVHFKEDFETDQDESNPLTFLQSQINEDNLLLLIILVMSSRTEIDNYLVNILPSYFSNSIVLLTLIKCSLMLIVYILAKKYLLPKIKL